MFHNIQNQLREMVLSHMKKLQKLPARAMKYFNHVKTAYDA